MNDKSVNALFLAYLLRSKEYRAKITLLAQGSTRFNISKTNLLKMIVTIPSDIEEQQKIAEYLSTLDSKIEKEKDKLGYLTEFKKGLMQQMFI